MKLTFYNRKGKQQVLGIFETQNEAEQMIRDFLREHNYNAPYWRVTNFDDRWVYDVGSWSEFFAIYKNDDAKLVGVWNEGKGVKRRRLPTI